MGKQMITKVLIAMMRVSLWWQRDNICRNRGCDCKGCPFDKGKVCDKVSTDFILENAGSVFTEYFNTLPESKTRDILLRTEPQQDITITQTKF